MRIALGRRLHLRRIPEIRFLEDLTLERASRIEQILDEVLPHDAEAAEDAESAEETESAEESEEEGAEEESEEDPGAGEESET